MKDGLDRIGMKKNKLYALEYGTGGIFWIFNKLTAGLLAECISVK